MPARRCSFCPANTPLAVAVRERRAELDLALDEAELLSGIPSMRWLALECGAWAPEAKGWSRLPVYGRDVT